MTQAPEGFEPTSCSPGVIPLRERLVVAVVAHGGSRLVYCQDGTVFYETAGHYRELPCVPGTPRWYQLGGQDP